jgi:hypothetical protein
MFSAAAVNVFLLGRLNEERRESGGKERMKRWKKIKYEE